MIEMNSFFTKTLTSPNNWPIVQVDDSFASSFRPILTCFRLLGVNLVWQEESKRKLALICIGSFLWFLANMSNCAYLFARSFSDEISDYDGDLMHYYSNKIALIVEHIQSTGVYAAQVWASWFHGHQLLDAFLRIEKKYQTSTEIYTKIRRAAIIGVTLSIVSASLGPIANVLYYDTSAIPFACYTFEAATNIYFTLSAVMFCVLVWALAMQFEEIEKQVDNVLLPRFDFKRLLKEWSIHHSLICRAVFKLETYFSVISLISIGCTFARMGSLFYVIREDDHPDYYALSIIRTVEASVLLYAVCSAADMLTNNALRLHQSLLSSPLLHSELYRNDMAIFAMQVRSSLPKITIAGWATVNRKLIPALIGTTASYIIILITTDGYKKDSSKNN